MITLNEGQAKAKKELLSTINSSLTSTDKFHTLRGGAGFGKSTLIVDMIRDIGLNKSICIATPTHKSLKVIDDMLLEQGLSHRVDTGTIHSILGLKLIQKGSEEVTVKDERGRESSFDVLLIDESSMLDDMLLLHILECNSKVIIFIGDECQISPVDSDAGEISKVFTEVIRQSILTEVVRCAIDNPIIRLATKLRESQKNIYTGVPDIIQDIDDQGNGVYTISSHDFANELFNYINTDKFRNNIDYVRCIAYTNAQVDKINKYIRYRLHGDVEEYIVGEMVIAQETLSDGYRTLYKNSDELEIIKVEQDIDFEHTKNGIPCYILTLKTPQDEMCRVKVVKESGMKEYEHLLETYSNRAKTDKNSSALNWRTFWNIKKSFNSFKHIYCMTAHKSQGSTFDNTFVYLPEFLAFGETKEIKELLYTSTTRSKYRTYFAK